MRILHGKSLASDELRIDALEQGQHYLQHKVNNIENQLEVLSNAQRDLEETENEHFSEMKMTMEDYKGDINKLRRQMRSSCINDWRTKVVIAFIFFWLVYMMFTIPPHLIQSLTKQE